MQRRTRESARFAKSIMQLEPLESRQLLSTTTIPGYTPAQIRKAYAFDQITFPSGVTADGAGQTIAIVDAFNDPNITSDLNVFNTQFNLPSATLQVVNQTGGSTLPATDAGWAGEISLDVEWAHAIAPGAKILLVETNSDSLSDLISGVDYARHTDGVSTISMSWGGSEFFSWYGGESASEVNYDPYFTTPAGHTGITFVAAAGDSGSQSGVEWPAISPNVLSVGGTTLNTVDTSGTYNGETGWSGTNGGFSQVEAEPTYQQTVQSTGVRTGPDVAYDADPNTGFAVYDSLAFDGTSGWQEVGGTSAGAPQWAALIAIADQGRSLVGESNLDGPSQTLPALYNMYADPSSANYSTYASDFNDVSTGGGSQFRWRWGGFGQSGYTANYGYDLITGLGSPTANNVVAGLIGGSNSTSGGTGSTGSGSTGSSGSGDNSGGDNSGGSTSGGTTGSTGGTTSGGTTGSTGGTTSGGTTGTTGGTTSGSGSTGTTTTVPLPASPIHAVITSSVPTSANGGDHGAVAVRLTNIGLKKFNGPVTITLYASIDGTISAADTVLTTSTLKQLVLIPHTSTTINLSFTYPMGMSSNKYKLIASVDPTALAASPALAVSTKKIAVTAATVDLATTFSSTRIRVSPTDNESATITIRNLGNVAATGILGLSLYGSLDDQLDASDLLLASISNRSINLKPGKSMQLTMHFTAPTNTPGTYDLIAAATSSTSPADSNPKNDVAVAKTIG